MSGERVERRLAAILAVDVAGYSRLMGQDEAGTLARLKAHRRELIDPSIAEHKGRIVKTTGDGMLIEFPSVVEAVSCAVALQRGMVERNAGAAEDQRIVFRVGVNLGDIIVDDEDIFGDGVNIAARLEALAESGGICISRVVRDQIRDKLPYAFEDMGEQSVKNIARPIRVYALSPDAVAALPKAEAPAAPQPTAPRYGRQHVAAIALAGVMIIAGGMWWTWPSPQALPATVDAPVLEKSVAPAVPSAAPRLSIVVLPFNNLSDDREQQYFADGVTEDLTTDLSRIVGSVVISRNTAFSYKNKAVNAKQIGRELGVRYVLQGSIQRSGKQVRVNAQLIDAESDAHLWAERFDGDTSDLLALQDEITSRIAVALNLDMITTEAARPIENPDALDYILRGRAAYAKPPTRDNRGEAIGLFEHALALDPRSVEAQSYLANVLITRVFDNMSDTAAADIERAEGLAEQALATSPRSPIARMAKGHVLRAQDRCEDAIPQYEAALASNRNWVAVLASLGLCKMLTGSIEEAITAQEQALHLSPRDPNVAVWYSRIGVVHLLQSRTDEAIGWLEKARSTNPGLPFVHAYLASAYGLKGETERAAAELAEARRLGADGRYTSIARLQAVGYFGVPKIRALYEATFVAGLRKAGMLEK